MNAWLFVGAVNGFLAVAAGAFGAHGLQGKVDAAALQVFETAARYHMYHALALGLAAVLHGTLRLRGARVAAALFLAGIVVFSGSLYLLALTGQGWLGAVTPVGGVAFLAGWATIAYTALRKPR